MENLQEVESKINYEWDLEKKEEDFSLELDFYDEKEQEDKLWQARTGLNYDTLCGAIETLIFMSDKPIGLQKIRSQIDEDLPLRVVHESLSRLQKEYEQKHHGIRLMEVAEGYQFRTKATYSKFVQDLFKLNTLVLSPTSLEVLAILAYKQPISKTDIDKIRGVDSSHIVRALMDKRLVKIVGRSEDIGKPTLYGTTDEFLDVFNLANIDELPPEYELEELANANSVGDIHDMKEIVSTNSKEKFSYDEIDELDSLAESIKSIKADTDFIKTLQQEDKKRLSGEAEVIKSAFDILEEYILKEETVNQNQDAANSELPTSIVDVRIVPLAEIMEDKLFNAPQIDEEFESLDEPEVIEELLVEEEVIEESIVEEDAALELEKALDDAFDRLTQGNAEVSQNLEETIEKGRELGIDLNFLQDSDDSFLDDKEFDAE